MSADAFALLESHGAATIAHPGGTLLAHLGRVHELLLSWGAREDLCLAGLCHAFYGTDGFAVALGDPVDRTELAAVIGPEAENIVYLYGACAREETYPSLMQRPVLTNRFTGARVPLSLELARDFAELTVANELDVMDASPEMRARHGAELAVLFTSWKGLISPAAQAAISVLEAGR